MSSNDNPQHIGDNVGNDKIGGDQVDGDKNSVGSIDTSGSTAIGTGSSAITNNYYSVAMWKDKDALLEGYLDRMQDLLLRAGLGTSKPNDPVRHIALTRTLRMIKLLDAKRNKELFLFLQRAKLLTVAVEGKPVIDFSYSDLRGITLAEANLNKVNLQGANLEGANLRDANLEGANLRDANLEGANLRDANLKEAILAKACLLGVNFRGADLERASIQDSILTGVNFSKTNLSGADLSRSILYFSELFKDDLLLSSSLLGDDYKWGNDSTIEIIGKVVVEPGYSDTRLRGAFFNEDTILPNGSKWTPSSKIR